MDCDAAGGCAARVLAGSILNLCHVGNERHVFVLRAAFILISSSPLQAVIWSSPTLASPALPSCAEMAVS